MCNFLKFNSFLCISVFFANGLNENPRVGSRVSYISEVLPLTPIYYFFKLFVLHGAFLDCCKAKHGFSVENRSLT